MDALPIVLAYQKIFDAWIEERLISPWRENERGGHTTLISIPLEKDLTNILTKKYTLSIGRLYQILEMIREDNVSGIFLGKLLSYWEKEIPDIFNIIISSEFFLLFSEIMTREIFSKKRHEKKVTFSDGKIVR
jgi:hypothetical protein